MTKHMYLVKEGGWIIIGQIAMVLGALVLVRMLTEYLDPDQYGQLALGITIASLVNQVILGGISNAIGRYYSIAVEKQKLEAYFSATRRLLGYATVIALAVGITIIFGLIWLDYSTWISLAAAATVFSLLNGYNSALNGIQNAARQRAIVAFHSGLDAWLKILLSATIIFLLGASAASVVVGYCLSSLVTMVSQLTFLRKAIPTQTVKNINHKEMVEKMWVYSLPFVIWGPFTWVQQVSDRWALQAFSSIGEVGQYAVLFQLGYVPISLATAMFVSFMGPIIYQRAGDATDEVRNLSVHRITWRLANLSLFLTLGAFAMLLLLHRWVFGLLVAEEYRDVSYLLPWVLLAGGIFAAAQILALKIGSELKPQVMRNAKIITALLGVIFNVIGAKMAGMDGVVYALVAFSGLYYLWMTTLARKIIVTKKVTDSY